MNAQRSFRVERPVEEADNPFWDVNHALRMAFPDGEVRPLALGEHVLRLVETFDATQALLDHRGSPITADQVVEKIQTEMPPSFFEDGVENAIVAGVFYRQSGRDRLLAVELQHEGLYQDQAKLQEIIDKALGPPGISLFSTINITVAAVVSDFSRVADKARDNNKILQGLPSLRVNLGPGFTRAKRRRKPRSY